MNWKDERMTTTRQDARQFPMWEKCAIALAVIGGSGTAAQVRDFLVREGEPADLAAVNRGLRYAGYWGDGRPPLVKIANPGQGRLNFYRLTDAGRTWAATTRKDEPMTTEPAAPSITCPACGRTSWNPTDVREGYCGNCHDWTAALPCCGGYREHRYSCPSREWPATATPEVRRVSVRGESIGPAHAEIEDLVGGGLDYDQRKRLTEILAGVWDHGHEYGGRPRAAAEAAGVEGIIR